MHLFLLLKENSVVNPCCICSSAVNVSNSVVQDLFEASIVLVVENILHVF